MTRTRKTPLWVGLLGATVLTPVLTSAAFAQTAAALSTQGDPCAALTALAGEEDRLRDAWEDATSAAAEAAEQAPAEGEAAPADQ